MRLEILKSLTSHAYHKRNEHNYAPIVTNPLAIDFKWYKKLPHWIRKSLKEKLPDFKLTCLSYPHKGWTNDEFYYWEFYVWFICDIYDMTRYIHLLEDAHVVLLDKEDKRIFGSLFRGHAEYDSTKSWKDMKINSQIAEILEKYKEDGCFIKLTQRSAKNDLTLFAAFTVEQVYQNLLHSNDVYKEIDASKGIVLQRWRVLPKENEYRVFILDKKIKGISQQYWDKPLKTIPPLSNFEKATIKIKELINKIPYSDAVFDMYIDSDQVRLLEINPAGRWAASSSALFTWAELCQKDELVKVFENKANIAESKNVEKEEEEKKDNSNPQKDDDGLNKKSGENIVLFDADDSDEEDKNNDNKVKNEEINPIDNTDFPIRILVSK